MTTARVESVDAIRGMRVSLVKFAEGVNLALMDADGDAQRTLTWLENEARVRWESALKKCAFDKSRAEEALRQKKIFKDPSGARQSYIDEEKALQKAKLRLEEATRKLEAVRKWTQRLQRDMVLYKGAVGPLSTSMQSMVPVAIERLGGHVKTLEQYVALAVPEPALSTGPASPDAGMTRPAGEGGGVDWRVGYDVRALRGWAEMLRAKAVDRTNVVDDRPALSLGPIDAQVLARMPSVSGGTEPLSDASLLIAAGTREAPRLFWERVTSGDGDSGWAVAPLDVEPAKVAVGRVSVGRLLTDRPELGDILRMPAGSVVIMDAGGIVAVFDATGHDVWPAAVAAIKG